MASSKAVTTSTKVQNGLLPTPPMPAGLPKANLTDNARQVLMKRYVRRGDDGQPAETVEEMFWRVAYHVARVEEQWGGDVQKRTVEYYHLLSSKKFFPNSPTFTGAGTPLGQLAACFVLKITDDMGRDDAGIFQTLRDAALIQQTGGGNGFSFSRLRPKGSMVKTSAGQATGPVGFLRVYDHAFGEIAQGGCLLPETLVFTNKGLLRLDEIVNSDVYGWQEHVLSVPTDAGLKGSPRGYNNGVADILRVHTRQGLGITGTPNHKVKVMTDNGPQWKEIQDLAKGDWILVRLGEHMGKLQILKKPVQKHGNQVMPNLPSILDEEFAFFLGYLAGDGFVAQGENDHRLGVSVAHTSYLMEEMPALLGRLFNVKIHKMQKPNDGSATFVIDNRAVKDFLVMNGLGKHTSRDVSVPRLIRQSPPNIVGAYLRGLFEADGALSHGYPTLMTTSTQLAREVATLLIGLGCPVRIRTASPGLDHWGDAQTYQVRITSTVGLQAWREKIGCAQRSRFVAAYAWESDQRRESTYVLPNPKYWLQPVLDAITLEQIDIQGRGRNINFRATEPHLRRQILRYYRDRNLTRSGYDLLRVAHPAAFENVPSMDGLWFVKVDGVESAGQSLTLDLEVADNHTYLAYGMVTHNTRRGANMGVLRVDHPDVEEFIECKTNENHITNFNISVGITDAFVRAVKSDGDWELRFPELADVKEKGFSGTLEQAEAAGINIRSYKKIRARELFNKIVKQAHHNGEPGVLFLDAANRSNPVPHLYPLEATNPCFVGSTRIATDLGLLTIQELAENEVVFMVANDQRVPQGGHGFAGNSHGIVYRASSPAWKTRENVQTFRLTTKHGYTVTATSDHKFLTKTRGYVEVSQLKENDILLLQSGVGVWSRNFTLPNVEYVQRKMVAMARGGDHASGHTVTRSDFAEQYANFPKNWSHELGVVVGTLVGDGWLSPSSNSPMGIVFNRENDELLTSVQQTMQTYFRAGHLHERGSVRQLTFGRLPYEFFSSLGVLSTRAQAKRVPNSIWSAPREAVIGFLQGLFTTDGTVNISSYKKSCSIRLASSSVDLLRDAQMLLLNFGIVSRIHKRREAGLRSLPDGKGGLKEYFTQSDYELIIDKVNRDKFVSEIGFLDSTKQKKAQEFILSKSRVSNKEAFETEVVSIEAAGYADVYDLTEPQTHSVIANGIVAHQCGEQWLGPNENCCLGSVNLNEHCGPDGTVDWETLRQSVVLATRFLDDVVEANAYVPAVPQLKEAAHRARRIGLGIMGLADLMYHVGVRYGSQQGQEFGAQAMEFVRYHAMKTSIELAEERGPFPAIEGSIYDMDNLTWTPPQSLVPCEDRWGRPEVRWEAVVEGIRKHGIRNAAQTTVAPTGCLVPGTLVTTDHGLLPIEALGNTRGEQWQNIDLRVSSEGGVLPATNFYINGSAHTLRVVTRRGYTLQGTDHHRLRVLEHGEWVWKRLDELKAGMRVPLQVSGLIGKPRHVLLDASLTTNFHPVTVKLPEKMTPELAYLVGFFMGDGSLKDRSLRFSVSDECLQHHIASLLKKAFGVSPEAYPDKRSNGLISLDLHSVNIVEFWKNNGFAKPKPFEEHQGKGYLPHIPLAILRTNDAEIYGAFLSGLFDADGASHKGRLLTWVSTHRQFHDQIKAMLFALGILTTSDVQRTGKSNQPLYRLRVSHTQSANRLRRQLPYLVRLSFETSSVRRSTLRDIIPITEGEYQSVLELAESGAEEQRVWGWRQRGLTVSREALGNFVERHRQALGEAGLDRLADVVEREIYFDEVVTIEDGGVQDTYDISVPDTHAYIANGFISHNTIATVAGCEGYGCEPVFALAYIRHVNDNGKDLKLTYASPRFDEALKKLGLGEERRQEIVEQVMRQGTCQQVKDIPQSVRDVFVVSADITAEEHVRMQAALQAFVDNSLSKCVTGDTLVLTASGLMPISAMSDMRLPDQFEAQDVAIVSPAGIERSDSFYYGGMRETRRVMLAHGFEIKGTPNHRVHVLQADGRVDFKTLDDLKIGDEVLLYMGQQVFGPESQPLPAFTGEFRTDAKKLRFPLQMSAELAYLLGCITSEGSIGENSIQICNGDRALLERLGGLFEALFGLNSHIFRDPRRASVFSLQVHSRPLRNWLLNDLGVKAGARNKIIPNCILRAGRNEIAAFLRGLFLDAYMTLDGRMFGIGLASRRLLRQLQTLLLNFGVFSMIHRSAEHAWVLNVSGEALELLASFVEFEEVWKNERIEIRNEGRVHIRHNYATLLPESVTTNLRQMQENAPESLRSLFGELPRVYGTHEREYQRARVNLLQGHRLERSLAKSIYNHFKDYATPFAQKFFSVDQAGILYVKVQRVEAGFAEVFDISVPVSHSFIANGIGNHNTVNFPETATEEDVAKAYMLAWELGCKGITVYVTGSREKVVLETKATAEKKEAPALSGGVAAVEAAQKKPEIAPTFSADPKRPRPRVLSGKTYSLETPAGKAFITINENGGEQPFEAFINTAKAGSETAAVSEAIGRLISYILRMSSPTKQTDRLHEVVRQLMGIGGGRSLGMGPNRVRSLPDGIGQVLDMYLREKAGALPVMEEKSNGNSGHQTIEDEAAVQKMKVGDLCPECGEAAVVNEEGCRKCYACGYSEC